MRLLELRIKIPSKKRQRFKFLGPALLTVLVLAYARKQPGVPLEPAPVTTATLPPQIAVTIVPQMPPPLPVALRPPVVTPVKALPARPTVTAVTKSEGALTPSPATLVFNTTMIQSANSSRTSSQNEANGTVVTRSETTFSSEKEVEIIARSVSISNTGSAPVKISQALLDDAGNDEFSVVGDTCASNLLAPQAACVIVIRFSAKTAGAYSSQLAISSDLPTLVIPLSAAVTTSK